jgi:fructose-1,6-bisphosphatase/inositol monophosphatase family enzyme
MHLFTGVNGSPTLVIDPVDGTAEYIAGLDSYSICVALVDSGAVRVAIVYFPSRDIFYCLSPEGPMIAFDFLQRGLSHLEPIKVVPNSHSPIVFHNSRVPPNVLDRLRKAGFIPTDDTDGNLGCPDAILRVSEGRAVAYVAHTRQMRDMLLGAILQSTANFCALDWSARNLMWPNGGRVPRAIFAPNSLPKSLLDCLSDAS